MKLTTKQDVLDYAGTTTIVGPIALGETAEQAVNRTLALFDRAGVCYAFEMYDQPVIEDAEVEKQQFPVIIGSFWAATWNPYEWHDHHKPGKPRWRVRAGMIEERNRLCAELDAVCTEMETTTTFELIHKWERVKAAILSCEENEEVAK